jgi:hypothetical protein
VMPRRRKSATGVRSTCKPERFTEAGTLQK